MLPSVYRLPKKDFIQTMRRGIRSHINGMQFISSITKSSHARLGILVTKKFSKKAVDRNRIKRRIADAFLPYFKKTTEAKDIVCKIAQPIHQHSFQDIQNSIETLLHAHS